MPSTAVGYSIIVPPVPNSSLNCPTDRPSSMLFGSNRPLIQRSQQSLQQRLVTFFRTYRNQIVNREIVDHKVKMERNPDGELRLKHWLLLKGSYFSDFTPPHWAILDTCR